MTSPQSVLVIDNYDSFTYNLVQYLGELGAEVEVVRNDLVSVAEIMERSPQRIVISPGPRTPDQAGISVELVQRMGPEVPILGVCLGHQSIARAYGANISHARRVMHGKTSPIHHSGGGIFRGLANPFEATRYHSLVAEVASLPDELEVTAWTLCESGARDEVMGIAHREHPVQGVQFHPESILTEAGKQMLGNFLSS
jgi:anthranilate synthase component II